MSPGWIAHRVNIHAQNIARHVVFAQGLYRAARRVDDHHRMIGINRLNQVMSADEWRDGNLAPFRFILSFPGTQPRMIFETVNQPAQFRLLGRRADAGVFAQVRQAVQTMPRCGIHVFLFPLEIGGGPPSARAEKRGPGGGKLADSILFRGCSAVRRRRHRETDGKNLLPVNDQHLVGVDGGARARRAEPAKQKQSGGRRRSPKTSPRSMQPCNSRLHSLNGRPSR